MVGRVWRGIGVLMAAIVASSTAAAADPAARIHRIVAIGDLHGDYAAWRDIARAAHLVDEDGHWAGGETVLVQTGDVADRGPDSLKIIDQLMALQDEAPKSGGRVVALVGNHEAMNMTDDLRYVSAGELAAFVTPESEKLRDRVYDANRTTIEAALRKRDRKMSDGAVREAWLAATPLGQIEHQMAWHPEGRIGRWVASNPAVVLLDDTLFVHGGISAVYAHLSIAEINRRVAAALARRDSSLDSIINDENGPLWYRGLVVRWDAPSLSAPRPPSIEEELDEVLHAYGAKRIVVAHTPILSGIAIANEGKLVRIDTGISAFYGGTPSYLEIVDGVPIAHSVERSTPLRKGLR